MLAAAPPGTSVLCMPGLVFGLAAPIGCTLGVDILRQPAFVASHLRHSEPVASHLPRPLTAGRKN